MTVPDNAYMTSSGRFVWVATCAAGHETTWTLLPHERPPSECGHLLRDAAGAWKEDYGACRLVPTYEIWTQRPPYAHRKRKPALPVVEDTK